MNPLLIKLVLMGFFLSLPARSVQVASEDFKVIEYNLTFLQDLHVYKDPSLFLGTISQLYTDPNAGWQTLMKEKPLLTSLRGKHCILQLGPATEFKNFGRISLMYEMAEPRLRLKKSGNKKARNPMIIPVKLCGDTAYNDSLGFVLETDLKKAQRAKASGTSMPPSTIEIPTWNN